MLVTQHAGARLQALGIIHWPGSSVPVLATDEQARENSMVGLARMKSRHGTIFLLRTPYSLACDARICSRSIMYT